MTYDLRRPSKVCSIALQIDAGRSFCAGLMVTNGKVTYAAPILRWMMGKTLTEVYNIVLQRGWRVRRVA